MKKIICTFIFCLLLTGCNGATDSFKCYLEVQKAAGANAEIYPAPNTSFAFLVRDVEGNIWYYKTNDLYSPKVTDKTLLIPARK
jgi:hypothetical protein